MSTYNDHEDSERLHEAWVRERDLWWEYERYSGPGIEADNWVEMPEFKPAKRAVRMQMEFEFGEVA